jgi:hypothetical protein
LVKISDTTLGVPTSRVQSPAGRAKYAGCGLLSAEYTFASNFVEGRPFLSHHEFGKKCSSMVRRYWIATLVDTNDVARYARECACVLREIFENAWLKTLCADFESNPTGPGSHAGEHYDSEGKISTIIAIGSASLKIARPSMTPPPTSSPRP